MRQVEESLTRLIQEHLGFADRERRQHPDVIATMVRQGLFKLWVPRWLGGAEMDLPASLEVFEAVSRIDGSAGWTATIGTGGGLFAAYLEREAAREIFAPADACIAGSGTPSGEAHRIESAYRAHGSWRYASGAHHATWFTANCLVKDAAGLPVLLDGAQLIRAMAFRPEQVEILDMWDTWGMRATDSHDFRVEPTVVPASHTFSVFTDAPREQGPLYRFPFVSIAEASFGAVALGVGQHAIDSFVALAERKRSKVTGELLADRSAARIRVAEADLRVTTAREALYHAVDDAWQTTIAGEYLGDAQQRRVRLASINAAESAAGAAALLHPAAGMSSLFMSSDLGRAFRDAHALTQHAMLSPLGMEEAGRGLLGSGG